MESVLPFFRLVKGEKEILRSWLRQNYELIEDLVYLSLDK